METRRAPSYLIVGAGVFGASTALRLKRSEPSARVTLIDRSPFPNPSAASHDLNKIIRADYPDLFYAKRALAAQKLWRSDPIYKEWYHETGIMFAEDMGMGRKALQNYNTLGVDHAAELTSPEIAKARFGGFFKDANWSGNTESYWNPRSGWAEAAPALKKVIKTAIAEGVTYIEATVSTLCLTPPHNSHCTGLKTTDGKVLTAEKIILCTGGFTAKLLADSAPHDAAFQINGRLVAAGAVSCTVKLTPDQHERFRDLPVFFNGMSHTHGEAIPPTHSGHVKLNHDISFTHNTPHHPSSQLLSTPPPSSPWTTWTHSIPPVLKAECRALLHNLYGPEEACGMSIESYRICWDAVTPTQDFLITPHPRTQHLYLATGGSFHSWKFLPTLGGYVEKMVRGELSEEEVGRWGWGSGWEGGGGGGGLGEGGEGGLGGACEMYKPGRDWSDIVIGGG